MSDDHIMGWCSSGMHARVVNKQREGCPGEFKAFYTDERTKKPVEKGTVYCTCKCHGRKK